MEYILLLLPSISDNNWLNIQWKLFVLLSHKGKGHWPHLGAGWRSVAFQAHGHSNHSRLPQVMLYNIPHLHCPCVSATYISAGLSTVLYSSPLTIKPILLLHRAPSFNLYYPLYISLSFHSSIDKSINTFCTELSSKTYATSTSV